MNRSKSTRLVLTLGAVGLLSGCNSLYTDMVRQKGVTYYVSEAPERPFLGVVVANHLQSNSNGRIMTLDEGVRIARVLAESPAAKAGLSSGDHIVRYGVHRIRSISDLTKAIVELGEGEEVEVALRAHSKAPIRVVTVKPQTETTYATRANSALRETETSDGTYLHWFFQSWDTSVSSEAWLAYQGFELPDGSLLHSGFALMPFAPDMFSIFSVEDTDVFCDAARVSLFTFPLRLSLGGGPDEDLVEAYSKFRSQYDRL